MKILLRLCEEPFECDLPLHVYDEVDYPEQFEDVEELENETDGAALVDMPDELFKRFLDASNAFWSVHAELMELFEERRGLIVSKQIAAEKEIKPPN